MSEQYLPTNLYTNEQVRLLERVAIEQFSISSEELMERAGAAAWELLKELWWPKAKRIVVFCGAGNNAGDGYVLARLARQHGCHVVVLAMRAPENLKGAAGKAAQACKDAGVIIKSLHDPSFKQADVVVDALLGTGLDRDIEHEWREAVEEVNQSGKPVLSLDVPSGVNVDTGNIHGVAVHAVATITFIGLKQGLLTGMAPNYTGKVYYNDLGIPPEVFTASPPKTKRLSLHGLQEHYLRPRARDAHKGCYGHVLIVGGNLGMPGAVRMAAEAALRVGAGLVSVATQPEHIATVTASRPEIMGHAVRSGDDLRHLLDEATAIVIGPGLRQTAWSRSLMEVIIEQHHVPVVLDADALNILSGIAEYREDWILTPHPLEAARLLHIELKEVQADRFAAVEELQHRYGGAVVLKGAGSLVATMDGKISICDKGNPGMASGGMGDLLSGTIAGFLAQEFPIDISTHLGVEIHAAAGDLARAEGERGMLATDLYPYLRRLVNPLQDELL